MQLNSCEVGVSSCDICQIESKLNTTECLLLTCLAEFCVAFGFIGLLSFSSGCKIFCSQCILFHHGCSNHKGRRSHGQQSKFRWSSRITAALTAAFNSLATLDAVSFKGCNFPLHCKLQSELKKAVNLALRTFLVLIFLRRKVGRCLVLRFLRVCFLQGRASQTWTVGDGQISKETPDWIGLGWDRFK